MAKLAPMAHIYMDVMYTHTQTCTDTDTHIQAGKPFQAGFSSHFIKNKNSLLKNDYRCQYMSFIV